MDALIFLTILSIVSTGLFSYIEMNETEEPLAKTVVDDLMSVKLQACDIYDTGDTRVFRLAELIAADINTGSTSEMGFFIKGSLDDMIPAALGYRAVFTYNGNQMTVSRSDGNESSAYECKIEIEGGGSLGVRLAVL
jgi:hypothetical protein